MKNIPLFLQNKKCIIFPPPAIQGRASMDMQLMMHSFRIDDMYAHIVRPHAISEATCCRESNIPQKDKGRASFRKHGLH